MTRRFRPASALLSLAALIALASPLLAQLWSTHAQRVMLDAGSPAAVRARLRAHADSVRAREPAAAGEALHWLGTSCLRAGEPDSAALAFAEARRLRDLPEDAFGLAEALLATRRVAAAESAFRLVAGLPPDELGASTASSRLWRAWGRARLSGTAGARVEIERAAREILSPQTPPLLRARWARRFAPLLLEAHADAWTVLAPLAVMSRGRDATLLRQAREASLGRIGAETFERFLAGALARQDSIEAAAVRAFGARPLEVRARDGFPLRAWLARAPGRRAPLVVLVGEPASAPWAAADSLVTHLRRAGCAVVLLDARGSGGSVGPGCALPDEWDGREDSLAAQVARDLSSAVAAALATGRVDPRRIAVGAVGPLAMAAALAARDDARVGGVVFIDASTPPVSRGPFAAALAGAGAPAFFQTGPASVEDNMVVDAIVARLPSRLARVAEAQAAGTGLSLFRMGPAEAVRLTEWLRWAWSSPRATPRARPR